jgi:signal transduction histidine kinase
MFGLSKSFYAKIFLLFIVTTLALYGINQLLIGQIGRSEMRKVFSERQINEHLRWGKKFTASLTDNELEKDLLKAMHVVQSNEIHIFTATPETGKIIKRIDFLIPEQFQNIKIQNLSSLDGTPDIQTALINFDGEEWNAVKLTTPKKVIVSLVNSQAADRHMEEFMLVRMRTIKQIFPFAMAMSLLAAFFAARKILAPIKRIQTSLREVDTRDLATRVPYRGEDNEFREFINVFNSMLERIERGFLQASRFSSDAAHELRTPLTIMQGYVERAINETESGSKIQMQLRMISDEIDRLSSITQKLLLLAQADALQLKIDFQIINASDMLEEIREDISLLDPPLNIRGVIQKQLLFETDRALFQQLLNNLLTNAVKYNTPNGWLDLAAWSADDKLHIRLSNPTESIDNDFAGKAFDRFSRGDSSHNRRIDGTGLGLSLCREIALAHNGKLTFDIFDQRIVTVEFTAPLKQTGKFVYKQITQ